MKILFNTNGNEKQKQVARHWINDDVEDIVYGGSKGSGKSYLGAQLIFADALIYPETRYFIARKKLNDLRRYTVPTITEVFDNWGLTRNYYKFNGQDNFFELYNGSIVQLIQAKYEPSDPVYARFGSMQFTRGWIEESGEFEYEATSNLKASIGRWKNKEYNLSAKLLQTCNPAKNYLYKDYYLKNKKNELEEYKRFVQALPEDNKMLPDGYLRMLERTLSKGAKERLLKGNWEYDDDPSTLIDYDNIISIFSNDHAPTGTKYITADIARLGSDKAVIFVWNDYRVIECIVFDKSRTTDIQNAINALRDKHKIPTMYCVADEDGVGGGVVDNCKIKGFVNGSRALNDENYFNLKTQCYYKLVDLINEYKIYIECELEEKHKGQLIEELEQVKSYEEDKEGKKRILPKEKVKDNIGRSPDFSDALMMRAYFDVANVKPSQITFATTLRHKRRR